MLKDFFRKLCCCHKWQRYKQADVYEDNTSKRPIMIKEILIGTKCGKIKKITL